MLRSAGQKRSDASAALFFIGGIVGLVAGLISFFGGGLWLSAGLVVLVLAIVTANRPDLAVGTLILALPLVGSTSLVSAPGIPDLTAGRLLIAWSLVVVGSAIRTQHRGRSSLLREDSRSVLITNTLPLWLCLLLGFTLLAGLRSPSLVTGLQGWLDAYLAPLGLLYISTRYRWSRGEADKVVASYLAGCCLWSALALFEALTQRSLFAAGGILGWASSGDPIARTGGPFINPAFLGTAAGIALVLAWVWASRGGAYRRVALACVPMSLIGLAVCLTRASWLAAGAGMLVVLALARHRRLEKILIALSGVTIVILLVVSLAGATFLENRTGSTSEIFNRVVVQRAALHIIADNPLVGIGSDRFATQSRQHLSNVGSISGSFGIGTLVPHNSILSATVDGGLGAGASLLVVMGVLVVAAKRLDALPEKRYLGTAALAGIVVLILNAMFVDMSLGTRITTLSLTIVGILLSTSQDREPGVA